MPSSISRSLAPRLGSTLRWSARLRWSAVCGLALALLGCGANPPPAPVVQPLKDVALTLAVVADAPLASAVRQVQGDWQARTGSKLRIEEVPNLATLAKLDPPPSAVLLPSSELGELARGPGVQSWSSEDLQPPDLAWDSVFFLLKDRACARGGQVEALPLGGPVLVCVGRADWLNALHRGPPRSWAEYQELAEEFSVPSRLPGAPDLGPRKFACAEPLGPGWAAETFLARAASAIVHPSNYSTLFALEDFEPLIEGPACVEALRELVETAAHGDPEQLISGPAEIWTKIREGRCGLALTWVPRRSADGPASSLSTPPLFVVELPGRPRVYNVAQRTWETLPEGELSRVPFVGRGGTIAAVPKSAAHALGGRQLLLALTGREWGPELSAANPAAVWTRPVTPTRAEQDLPDLEESTTRAAYVETIEATWQRQTALTFPRILGRERYLAALDEAVRAAVQGHKTPARALSDCAAVWRTLTAEYGLDAQLAAYRLDLGLSAK